MNFASSDILSGVHGGSNVSSSSTSWMPSTWRHGAVDVLRDERPRRTAHRGQAVRDLGRRILHLDFVHEAEVDDVHAELGILDRAENLEHLLTRRHAASVETRTIPAC